jgi:hypothetical protein
MQLPDFLSRNHPRDKEAPAWAKVLSEGMGLALEQQDIIMGQLEDVKDIASRLRSKIEHLGSSIEELKSRPQPVQEPDMSEVLSELNAAAADVDSLQASVTGPSEEQRCRQLRSLPRLRRTRFQTRRSARPPAPPARRVLDQPTGGATTPPFRG